MPHCETSENVSIYYETFGQGDTKVLLIMGMFLFLFISNFHVMILFASGLFGDYSWVQCFH